MVYLFLIKQEAGIPRKLAPTIGIAVDHRRVNLSTESHSANISRLKEYRARLILFPRRVGQPKKADSKPEELKSNNTVRLTEAALPISSVATRTNVFSERKISTMGKGEEAAYRRLREARSEKRLVGVREKRAKLKAEEASATKK
ncbi:hypothetical protein GP486_002633 [Trichoglossum hirsutum]|uniref:60S ribosomal protein L13 n=1 Tax=Trichoglossum hirsutum TaxID=265104 RepID=A0A9P8RRJ2_9PEZI|nr:hypothetical protein GP486_002633 [Trichoglossum hirsutum]